MSSSTASVLAAALVICLAAHCTAISHGRRILQQTGPVIDPMGPVMKMCAVEGPAANATFMNASRTCLQFWDSGAPIQVPNDNALIKYGQLWPVVGNQYAHFIDRHGQLYPITLSANPPTNELQLLLNWVLIVIRAELDTNGTVIAFTPVLYVPYTTVMSTMVNSQFEGQLFNSPPHPNGPNATSWFRWTFGSNITVVNGPTAKYGTFLYGTFDNLFRAVKDAKGNCRPALCADPTLQTPECKYYTDFFGNTTNQLTLSWDVNMHFQGDTELVPMFTAKHRQYMASFLNLYAMLLPYSWVPHQYTFIAHGTPLGIPQNFSGTLTRAQTPLEYC